MSGSANPRSHADPSSIPAIRTFQFDSTSIGDLASAVNLFRGDVNISQNLFTLPGRSRGTMDVSVSILYQSNVYRDAALWNRDAPTGVLGLGWSLPLTYIQANDNGSPDPDTRSYALFDNGSPTELVRQPQQHFLFTMPSSVAGGFQAGPVSDAVRAQFLQHGLPLDPSAMVGGSAGVWTLADHALQQAFAIQASRTVSDAYDVCYGGQSFQLQSYRFWQIIYFPAYERWLIVTDDGIRKSFGGAGPNTPQGYRTAAGNSIAWQVWWGANGVPAWTGPSSLASGQMQVARAWYLESTTNRFGDRIAYVYNGWSRNASGLIPDVEQQVGAGGLPYTKAVYLAQVTDVFGRSAAFSYGEKLWNQDGPREYADPHRDMPGNDPNAYQDLYETKYLANIALSAANGARLFTVRFDYRPRPSASGEEQAVANVTSFTGTLYDDTFKRYLTSITTLNAAGDALPGYVYTYHLDGSAPGAQPGALRTVTAPQGGTVTYAYTQQELSVCTRNQTIARPSQTPDGTPCVFYGDDYVVSLWYDTLKSQVTLQVYTWAGRWICWQLDPASPVLYSKSFDPSTIGVLANAEFFVVHLDTEDSSLAWVFSKDAARPGQFVPAVMQGVNTGANTPTLTLSHTAGTVKYTSGNTFFAAAQMNSDSNPPIWMYYVLTWRWSTQSWEVQTFHPGSFTWLTAGGEYFLAVDAQGNINLAYLDGTLTWQNAVPVTISGFSVPGEDYENVTLVAGAGMAALNLLEANSESLQVYQLYVIQWDANHTLQAVTSQQIQEPQALDAPPLGWTPVIVADSLVAVNGNLFRFNGADWLSNSTMVVPNPQDQTTQRYAYGPDYALQVITDSQNMGVDAAVLGFDPNGNSSTWSASPAPQNLPAAQEQYDNWPAGGNADYALLGPYLYFRGTATDWTQVPSPSSTTNIASLANQGFDFDSQSLINEGPAFLSYSIYPQSESQSPIVQSIVLQNGQVMAGSPVTISTQRMYTPSIEGYPAGPGASPQGPSVFVSYDADAPSFDQASEIYLNHYAGDAVAGPILHYPVTSIAVDDQYQDVATTSYFPDPAHAACDSSGLVVKYYQNTVYPGSPDPSHPAYGRVVNTYQNGLNITAANYYNMLDGLLVSTDSYDTSGNLLESHQSTWQVIQWVASDPVDPSAPPIQLQGGWIMRTQQISMIDGVTKTHTTSYAAPGFPGPYSGRPVTTSSSSYDGSGNPQTFVQAMTYGSEVSAAMRALNMRSVIAQTTTSEQTGSADPIVIKSSASAHSLWPCAAGERVQVPASEGTFHLINPTDTAFPFDSYRAGDAPAGWLLKRRVTARTLRGQVMESRDGSGTPSLIIFSADMTYPVAHISNAAHGSAAYLSFEPYEDSSAWTFTNTRFDTTDARTGTTSLLLPGGAAAQVSVALAPMEALYVVGCWYKTAAGFTPEAGAGATIIASGAPETWEFAPTNGAWVLKTIGVPGAGGAASLKVTLANPTATDVLLGSVYAIPLAGGMIARTFDLRSQLITSSTDAGGRTRWSFYDSFFRPTLQAGPNAQPRELAQRFLSRQGSSGGVFETTSPNAELTLHPAGGGSVETFVDGGAWQCTWQPANPPAWQTSGAALAHIGAQADTLVYQGALPATWAIYFEVAVGSQPPALSLAAGSVSVAYSNGGYAGWGGAQPLATPPQMARHWLLVVGDGVVLFFGDSQLLFSVSGSTSLGPPTITTSADLTFAHLALLACPRLSLSYKDGSNRQRQVHQLYGADSRVSEAIFDPLGRKVATTRVALGSFGSGAGQPVLQYRPGFVDVRAFLASLSSSWAMTGDVADYYQGQVVDGIQRSDDQGYPYRGKNWEASSRKRKIEIGLPGLPYAIANVESTTPAQRTTTQFAYDSNSGTTPTLPQAQYSQTTVTTPVKTVATRIKDKAGQSVATISQDSSSAVVAQAAGMRSYAQTATGPQVTLDLHLPNAVIAGPQSGDAAYVRTTVADAATRAVVASDPDSGQTQFIYDPCGRVRFVQPAMAAGDQWFFYTRYDAIGRVVEQGTVAQAWEPAALGSLAAQADWPTPNVPHMIAQILSYDGDGNDPTHIGQKIGCVTITPAPREGGAPCIAEESFTYDSSGRLSGVGLVVRGAASSGGEIGYSYNNLGDLTTLTLPVGAPLAQVVYTVNDQGWITAIGSSASSPSDIATYTYSADGVVETESLGEGAWVRAVEYTSTGWARQVLTTSADKQQRLALSYTYNPDSTLATREITYAFAEATATLHDTYTYDGQGRLVSAQGSSADQISSYDPNGNILAVTQAGAEQSFTQVPGTNRLQQANIGGSASPIMYDARGRATSVLGRTLSYDDATNLMIAATMGSQQVQLGYGGSRQRVLKQVHGQRAATTIYFTGPSNSPVARLDGSTWTVLVQGPTGLVAAYSDQAYYPLKDNEHNVWAVVNAKELVARYVYLPFGGIVADGPNPEVLPYTFMGQEWDPELELYNFRDRMYDPLLRRFLAPDSRRQFPSPYIFCANNPLNATDPSGDASLGARIGIGLGMGLLIVLGIAATVITGGAAAPAEAGLVAGEVSAETGAEVGAEVGGTLTAESTVGGGTTAGTTTSATAEGGTVGATQVSTGVTSGATEAGGVAGAGSSTAGSSVGANIGYLYSQAVSGLITGMGTSGLQYDIEYGRTFSVTDFAETIGWGALSGALGGALGGIPALPALTAAMSSLSALARLGINVAAQGVAGAIASDVTQILSNVSATGPNRPAWYSGLLEATLIGAGESAALGGVAGGISDHAELGTELKTLGQHTLEHASSGLEHIQALARADEAYLSYTMSPFYIIAHFGAWGGVSK